MKKKVILTLIAVLLYAAIYGCGVEPVSAVVPTATVTTAPAETVEPTVTATPTTTPEPTATSTPVPTSTPTPEPTATVTPKPTATSTPKPTSTPRPTPIPGECMDMTFSGTVTLDSGVEISVLSEFNRAGLYSDDTSKYGWYGDGQDNRDNGSLVGDKMDELEDAIGVTATNGTGFYVSNFSAEFYWGGVGPTPDLALYRDIENQCYYLAINYDISKRVRNYEDRDVLRLLLSICSSNPMELEELIYTDCFVTDAPIPTGEWTTVGDSQVCFPSYDESIPRAKWIYVIKQK